MLKLVDDVEKIKDENSKQMFLKLRKSKAGAAAASLPAGTTISVTAGEDYGDE